MKPLAVCYAALIIGCLISVWGILQLYTGGYESKELTKYSFRNTTMIIGSNITGNTKSTLSYSSTTETNVVANDSDTNSLYVPLKDIIYSKNGSRNSDRSVFVTPRRAYYDARIVRGKPLNALTVLTEVHDKALNTVVACEINGRLSKSITTMKENVGWVRSHKRGYTHRLVIIRCLGLPSESIVNGSVVSIIYKKGGDDYYSRVEAVKPLYLAKHTDEDPSTFDRGKGSVVVCTTLYGHPDMLDQWLRYQKTLNVDMVHLNVDSSFYENATELYPFLKESLDTGFVQMDVWNNIVNDRNYYKGQLVKYEDCLYRYIGVFEFGLFIDMDDFFNPVLTDHKDIHFYMSKYFAKNSTGSVYFSWRQMDCQPAPNLVSILSDGNLTSILSGNKTRWRAEAKLAHRLHSAKFVSIHIVQTALPGFHARLAKKKEVYVAHVRDTSEECS